jgi:hypothetical protein
METLEADPVTLASMIRLTMQMMALPPIWEGLESRSWASTELLAIEQELAKWKPIEDQIRCYRGDCALGLNLPDRRITEEEWAIRESMTGPIPRWPFQIPGVSYFNAANYFRASYRACYLPLLSHDWKSVSRERLYIDGIPEYDLHSILHRKELPIFLLVTERCVTLAIHVILARTAIALERYHLDRGSYPSELAALVPNYLSTLPTDLMDGAPLRYIPIENGRFKIYSIGWDFRDQKGKIKDHRTGRLADQVWTYDLADGDEPQPESSSVTSVKPE